MATPNTKIKICVRVRPFLPNDLVDDSVEVVSHGEDSEGNVAVTNPRDPAQRFRFSFPSCWDQSSTQEALFDRDVRPLLDQVYQGFTACIFCYGVTSSGKTHTMQGSESQPGIIPRVMRALLEEPSYEDVKVSISYMEIYKDDVYDLLVARTDAPKLPIREAADGRIFVAHLSQTQVSTAEEFDRIFAVACKSRSTGATLLNRESSRSHAILGIHVQVTDPKAGTTVEGKINLIDLAGSENNKLTGNDSTRMAESSAINRSLSVLGQVVDALNRGLPRIPYRNSKLTRILQEALGGSALSLLICNIAPGKKFGQDSLNTLHFASRTKQVENRGTSGGGEGLKAPLARPRTSMSLCPPPARSSRPSMAFAPTIISKSATSKVGGRLSENSATSGASSRGGGLSEAEMKEQIAKAVAEEVKRQVEEKMAAITIAPPPVVPSETSTNLKKSKDKEKLDLAEELTKRVEVLEKKNNVIEDDQNMAQLMSPGGQKKLAQALIAMARAVQDKGQLDKALDFYRRAQQYARNNAKLQVRIDEVQAALDEGKTLAQFKKDRAARASGGLTGTFDSVSPKKTRARAKRARAYDEDHQKENETVDLSNQDIELGRGRKRRKSSEGSANISSSKPALVLQLPTPDTSGERQGPRKARMQRSRGVNRKLALADASINIGTDDSVEVTEVAGENPAPFDRQLVQARRGGEDDWLPEGARRRSRRN